MAGAFPGGGADRFRQGVRFAMEMSAAPDVGQRAKFLFPSTLVALDPGTAVDGSGVPFDPTVQVVRQEPDPVEVPCAIEYYDDRGQLMQGFGISSASSIKVLLLDEEYEQVKDADRVIAGGDIYRYRRTVPPSGLFDVGIFELWFHAIQET